MSKGEDTRRFIIEKAAALFNRKGIAGTSISDIMEVTGLAKGGIYRRFESKEEITGEVFLYLYNRLLDRITAVIARESSAKGKLYAILDLYHDHLVLDKNGGCPLLNFGTEADNTDPVIRDRVAAGIKAIQDSFSRVVAEGIRMGEFSKKVNPGEFGVKMFSLLEGAILSSRVMNDKHQMKLVTNMLKNEIRAFGI